MNCEKRGGKWVFCKDGVHFALTLDQVKEMNKLTGEILGEEGSAMALLQEMFDAEEQYGPGFTWFKPWTDAYDKLRVLAGRHPRFLPPL